MKKEKKFNLLSIIVKIIREQNEEILREIAIEYGYDERNFIKRYLVNNNYIPYIEK
jgi:hypothetical protein